MPFDNGNLNKLEMALIQDGLLRLWPDGQRIPCRVCESVEYHIHPCLLGNRSDTVSVIDDHTRFPTVAVWCAGCGLVEHYSAARFMLKPVSAERKRLEAKVDELLRPSLGAAVLQVVKRKIFGR